MTKGDKITLVVVIAAVVLLSVRLIALYGQELYEDETSWYFFNERGYNITKYHFYENGTLEIIAFPSNTTITNDMIRSQEKSLMLIQIQEPGEPVL